MTTRITVKELSGTRRSQHAAKLFGVRFVFLEAFVFDTASSLSPDYEGGMWAFQELSNGGFYMSPPAPASYLVQCANGFEGALTSDAFGITTCLYAYSMLSFSPDAAFALVCADQFHLLRAFALEHSEARSIFAATD
jgi:hypothetical protein